MGQFAVPVSWYDVLALLLVISGVILYRVSSASHHGTDKEGESNSNQSSSKIAPYVADRSVQ